VRVLILGTRGFPNVQGGVEKHCECLSVNLAKLGCEVVVFTRRPYVDKGIREFKGVKLVAIPATRNKFLENLLHTLLGIIVSRWYNHDILHLQAIGSALVTPVARLLGDKVILTSHGSNYKHVKWGRFSQLVLRVSEYVGVKFANEVIAITSTIGGEIKKKYKREVTVIPNGVEIPDIAKSDGAIRRFNLQNKKYILSVGRLVHGKGFDTLIDAFIEAKLDDFSLVIVGQADHEDTYSLRLKQTAGKNKNVVLTGFLTGEALRELYSHADLFVLPSHYEGLPMSLLEAISYGLPCMASDIPGNRSVGLSEDRYFEAGNTAELAAKINQYSSRQLTKREKENQMNMIKEKYNWENIAHRTLELYRRLVVS
jgi:glycosyltransferase involved in cell wall biosynthesis